MTRKGNTISPDESFFIKLNFSHSLGLSGYYLCNVIKKL